MRHGKGRHETPSFHFISGGASAALSLPVRAQSRGKLPVIGFNSATAELYQFNVAAFRRMQEAGLVDGKDVTIEYRWAGGDYDRLVAWPRNSSIVALP